MVIMIRISVFNNKFVHKKSECCWECFVAPNDMVRTKTEIAIGIEKFDKTHKGNSI